MAEPNKGQFTITEILGPGSTGIRPARFVWDNTHRNAPQQPWNYGLELRTSRIDYVGTQNAPTEQVLGVSFTSFNLRGRWTDKFNFPGYATQTREEIEALIARGNQVKLQFQEVEIQGLITKLTVNYMRRDEIGWELQFSPHHRQAGGSSRLKRSPRTVLNARQLLDEIVEVRDAAIAIHDDAPRIYISGSIYQNAQTIFDAWDESIATLVATTTLRVDVATVEPGAALRQLGTEYLRLQARARQLIELLRGESSSSAVVFQSAALVLDFDFWSRNAMAEARRMIVRANRAANELFIRARPDARVLYRPQAGESLYGISNRFYRTPHNWRRIVQRNGLGNDFILTGDEILVIPEAGAR